jgi:hypothetical protein
VAELFKGAGDDPADHAPPPAPTAAPPPAPTEVAPVTSGFPTTPEAAAAFTVEATTGQPDDWPPTQ